MNYCDCRRRNYHGYEFTLNFVENRAYESALHDSHPRMTRWFGTPELCRQENERVRAAQGADKS